MPASLCFSLEPQLHRSTSNGCTAQSARKSPAFVDPLSPFSTPSPSPRLRKVSLRSALVPPNLPQRFWSDGSTQKVRLRLSRGRCFSTLSRWVRQTGCASMKCKNLLSTSSPFHMMGSTAFPQRALTAPLWDRGFFILP